MTSATGVQPAVLWGIEFPSALIKTSTLRSINYGCFLLDTALSPPSHGLNTGKLILDPQITLNCLTSQDALLQ